MPTASKRDNADKKLGGAATSSNETPVSSKEDPAPPKLKSGNTEATRPRGQPQGAAPPSTKAGARPGDHTEATGLDHPSKNEQPKPAPKRR